MGLKIARTKRPHELTVAERQAKLWQIVSQDQVLGKYLRPDHPFFEFTALDMAESLSFSVAVRGLPQRVVGTAFCYDLTRALADTTEEARFYAGVMTAVRALLFHEIGADTREERQALPLIEPTGLNWENLRRYIELSLRPLPLTTSFEMVNEVPTLHLTGDFEPITLALRPQWMEQRYPYSQDADQLFLMNEALRTHLMIWLSRGLMSMVTVEQAEVARKSGAHAAELARQAAAVLRSKTPMQTRTAGTDKMIEKLSLGKLG